MFMRLGGIGWVKQDAPAANAASKSSLPSVVVTPTVNTVKARYCATKDSRSMYPLVWVHLISLENTSPRRGGMTYNESRQQQHASHVAQCTYR